MESMLPKFTDFSRSELTSAIEDSLREFWTNWGHAPQSELYDAPNMLRFYTGVPYAFCNGVVCSRLSPDTIDQVIDKTVMFFQERNATWEWVVGPNTTPAFLDEALLKHGLIVRGGSTGMALNLDTIDQDPPTTDQLEIVPVVDPDRLELWANTVVKGFESPTLFPTFVNLECSLGCNQSFYRRFLAFLDQKPVATSALFLGKNVAGIYCVSTLPTARRLGIGAAITQIALREALHVGYHIAVLQASQMGVTVYQQLGFQVFSLLRNFSSKN